MGKKRICLDAGHYGKYNASPVVPGYYESDMAWKLHLMQKELLEGYGFEVITTRDSQAADRKLYDRGYAAKGCVLFISSHSNACGVEGVDYPVVYRSFDNRGNSDELAKKLAVVIGEVMGTKQAGRAALRKGASGGEYYGVLRGAREAGLSDYYILEHSFHTNATMTRWLMEEGNLRKLAEAECRVIAEHYGMTKDEKETDSGRNDLTKITGKAEATAEQMAAYVKSKNGSVPQSVLDMIPLYLSEGEAENIRGDIAFAQSCIETGNFTFAGSAVELSQNNFCGMGVTEKGMKGNSFETPKLGIRAQIQHLKAYANTAKLKQDRIDPRFEFVTRGCAPYVEYLGIQENPKGKGWAAGAGYGKKILAVLASILSIGKSTENPEPSRPSGIPQEEEDEKEPDGLYKVTTSCDALNIRSGPGTKYTVCGAIREKPGEKKHYTIVEERNGWGRLLSGAGWISLAYTAKVLTETYLVTTTCDILNIRSGPGTQYRVSGAIRERAGEKNEYTIVGEENGWGKLLSGAGWISLKYTRKVS